jgi:hypothetical protein
LQGNLLFVGPRNKPLSDAAYSIQGKRNGNKHGTSGASVSINALRLRFIKQKAALAPDSQRKAISKLPMRTLINLLATRGITATTVRM